MFTFNRFVLVFCLSFSFSGIYGQDKIIDSLKTAFQNPKIHDTTKMSTIVNIMKSRYTQNNPNYFYLNNWNGRIASNLLQRSTNKAVRNNAAQAMATYYTGLAIESFLKGEMEKAVPYIDKGIALCQSKELEEDKYNMYIAKAQFLGRLNETDKALTCLFAALKFYESQKNMGQLAYATTALAHVYGKQLKYEKALEYYKKVPGYYDKDEVRSENEKNYMKSVLYGTMGNAYQQLKRFDEAVDYYNKSVALSKKTGDVTNERLIYAKMGLVKLDQDKYDEAEKIFLDLLTNKMDARSEIHNNLALGRLYYEKNQFDKATPYAEKGYSMSIEKKYIDLQEAASSILFKIYRDNKDFKKALEVQEFSVRLKDSSKVEASKNALAQQQLKYDFEKKELQQEILQQSKLAAIKLAAEKKSAQEQSKSRLAQQQLKYDFEKKALNQKLLQGKNLSAMKLAGEKKAAAIKLDGEKKTAARNNWLIALSGVLLLLLAGVYFFYRNTKQKQAIAGLEKNQIKQKLLITQMNPHFIFNSVQNIRNLINYQQNDDAVKYLDKFSVLTRQILENSNENYISLEEEVAMIENYLSIQQLLYSHKFDFSISVQDTIETDSTFLPPMLTQPFIENAIKHGLSNVDANGMIDIRFYLDAGKLFFEVTDNGKGFDTSKTVSNHKSLAMTITRERLVGYTKNQDFTVQTDNIKDQYENVVGAKVRFEIPYIFES